LERFEIAPNSEQNKQNVLLIDGNGFFAKLGMNIQEDDLFVESAEWARDGGKFAKLVQEIRTNDPVSGNDVLKIRQKIKEIEEQVETLAGKIKDQQTLETKLETIKALLAPMSLNDEQQRRDRNANYKKSSPAEYVELIEFWPGRSQNPHGDKDGYPRALRRYYDQNGHAGDWHDKLKIRESREWTDEFQFSEYNAAVSAINFITTKDREKGDCERDIGTLQKKREEIVAKINKLEKEWDDLAMTTDLSPMIKQVERQMTLIADRQANTKEEKEQKEGELAKFKHMRDLYSKMQLRTLHL
jgi:hypothetical protein